MPAHAGVVEGADAPRGTRGAPRRRREELDARDRRARRPRGRATRSTALFEFEHRQRRHGHHVAEFKEVARRRSPEATAGALAVPARDRLDGGRGLKAFQLPIDHPLVPAPDPSRAASRFGVGDGLWVRLARRRRGALGAPVLQGRRHALVLDVGRRATAPGNEGRWLVERPRRSGPKAGAGAAARRRRHSGRPTSAASRSPSSRGRCAVAGARPRRVRSRRRAVPPRSRAVLPEIF